MKNSLYLFVFVLMSSCTNQSTIPYPETAKEEVKDTYFGTEVTDPYRWLEDDNSAETAAWVEKQNKVTFNYLESLPYREEIKAQLTDLMDYPKHGTPFKRAGKYFYFKNNGLQNQNVLYGTEKLGEEAEVILDPNTFSEDGTIALSGVELSEDGRYLVYMVAKSGSDWNEIFVKDLETGKLLDDHIQWVKFSGLAWYNNGFYYSAYDRPEEGTELSESNQYQKIYYHQLGTSQAEDQLIMEDQDKPKRMFGAEVTEDKRFLLVSVSEASHGNALSVKDLTRTNAEYVSLMDRLDYEFHVQDNVGDNLFVRTNYKAPKYRLVKIDVKHPEEENWVETIPEKDEVLQTVSFVGGRIVAEYMKDAHSVVEVYDYDGALEYEIELPGLGSVGQFSGKKEEPEAFYSYSSYNTPGEIYQFDIETQESSLFYRPEVKFNPGDFIVKQEFFTSKDGTRVPMFIVHKKGLKLDGTNPTLLYGYGGFNVSLTPSFSTTRMVFIDNGGIYVVANLRGGGEYGEDWHQAGTKLNKQNVFDDCIAAAEYLIAENYTSSEKLALMGGSNGGLLVGAVINQRPELFRVGLPAVGVMDMLRFHQFTIGWAWAGDYGTSEDSKEMFEYLYGYSPYHNIREDVDYPAVLVTTADHDDRVVPAHSFKYIARLQERHSGSQPTLIRIDTKAGHGAGKPTAKVIEEYTDVWSFLFFHLGMRM
ncbi:prolyl oligopeptidase family serine peptidase [uncultured Sunxiuqinia sp.]|uniref:prolyl oligopeptidase family serine peptidase n=1 Tax=uncultured Sunxiuqinia sp. TaxID=1573825 RepID=UPI0026116BDF|nr:prolyl oligopeptidase family serine peptidase [uncultured Sunxiuqinia sp.]